MSEVSRFNSYGRAEFSADGSLVDYWEHKCLVDKKDSQIKDLEKQLAEARGEKANLIKWLDQEKQDWGSSKKDTWNPYCRVLSKLKEKGDE